MEQLPECRIPFEDTEIGRMKERIYGMSDSEILDLAKAYGIPAPGEIERPGTYIQNTIRKELVENRRKNDIVIVPVGCTENVAPVSLAHRCHAVRLCSPALSSWVVPLIRGNRAGAAHASGPGSGSLP